MLPTMSWLVLALLVVFVVRMWLSMVTRRRQRAGVEARVPAQRTPPTSAEQPRTAAVEPPEGVVAPAADGPGPIARASEPAVRHRRGTAQQAAGLDELRLPGGGGTPAV
jgi:hypothetical protein